MAHRSFGASALDDKPEIIDPITFDVADEKDIGCRNKVNGKLLIELVGKVESGNVARQSEGILAIFDVCVLRDDGDEPESWSGRLYDPNRPYEHHTRAEINALAEEEVQPGIDPTSSYGRLKRVLDDPNTAIELQELAEMVGWLVEQYTGRPTRNAARSGAGGGSTSRGSRPARRSRAGTGEVRTLESAPTSSSAST
jgi:hypothetical protein